jgi:hypothetical protein
MMLILITSAEQTILVTMADRVKMAAGAEIGPINPTEVEQKETERENYLL